MYSTCNFRVTKTVELPQVPQVQQKAEGSFKCYFCGQLFINLNTMVNHMILHHGQEFGIKKSPEMKKSSLFNVTELDVDGTPYVLAPSG